MKTINTSEMTGAALDWAAAKAKGYADFVLDVRRFLDMHETGHYNYSTEWQQGGPIIEREGITVSKEGYWWSAYFRDNLFEDDGSEHWQTGPTPLIAAMRCYVASKMGDTIEVPEELQ